MMTFLGYPPESLQLFFLVFIRISVLLFLFPVFGSPVFPELAKAGLALILSLALFPMVPAGLSIFPGSLVGTVVLMASELIIGLILGLMIRMFFAAVQLAGQLISFQMGFAVINVLDPQTGSQVSILDQFAYWVVLIVFLLMNGHHFMIGALVESFQVLGVGMLTLKEGLYRQVLQQSVDMFVLAVKIGAPGIVALLFVSAAFGLCAKFAPQMNILIAAFPVQIVVGLFFFGAALDIIVTVTRTFVRQLPQLLISLLHLMSAG
ncbi:MAG: flagellar biosynthetic protein FliR [Thermodesulfobacteriota bacterium]